MPGFVVCGLVKFFIGLKVVILFLDGLKVNFVCGADSVTFVVGISFFFNNLVCSMSGFFWPLAPS